MSHRHGSTFNRAAPAPRARVLPRRVYLLRRAVALVAVALVVVAAAAMCARPEPESDPVPAAPVDSVREVTPVRIEQSRPLEMRIPAIELSAEFESGDCRVRDGAINPATMSLACAYTAADRPYELPGTGASDVVVTAGHASAGRPGVFDALYDASRDAHTVSVGDTLYMRTEASDAAGGKWLRYVATDLHEPTKDALSADPAVWGTGPTPGRLLTISCIQPLLSDSVRNAVVGWQFEGVSDAPE